MSPFAMPKTDFWCVETGGSGSRDHQDNLTKVREILKVKVIICR